MMQLAVILLGLVVVVVGTWTACSQARLKANKRLSGLPAIVVGNILNLIGLAVIYLALIEMPDFAASQELGEATKLILEGLPE